MRDSRSAFVASNSWKLSVPASYRSWTSAIIASTSSVEARSATGAWASPSDFAAVSVSTPCCRRCRLASALALFVCSRSRLPKVDGDIYSGPLGEMFGHEVVKRDVTESAGGGHARRRKETVIADQ